MLDVRRLPVLVDVCRIFQACGIFDIYIFCGAFNMYQIFVSTYFAGFRGFEHVPDIF